MEVQVGRSGTHTIGNGPRGIPIERADPVRLASAVFAIDHDAAMRGRLQGLIRRAGWRVRTFASAEEFLSHSYQAGPCCIVLDINLPGVTGLELQQRLADRIGMPFIFLSGVDDVPTTVQAMKAGAFEFLTKPFDSKALLDAVRGALEWSHRTWGLESATRQLRQAYASLSPREREVMRLVVTGLLNKQVGGELGISEITVKAHRGHAMRKMGAASLPDLVRMAATLRLPNAPSPGLNTPDRLSRS